MVAAVAGGLDVSAPLFVVLLGLDFEFVGDPLAFEFPVVFIDCRVDYLFLLVDGHCSYLLFVVQVVFLHNVGFVDHVLLVVAPTAGFVVALLLTLIRATGTLFLALRISVLGS